MRAAWNGTMETCVCVWGGFPRAVRAAALVPLASLIFTPFSLAFPVRVIHPRSPTLPVDMDTVSMSMPPPGRSCTLSPLTQLQMTPPLLPHATPTRSPHSPHFPTLPPLAPTRSLQHRTSHNRNHPTPSTAFATPTAPTAPTAPHPAAPASDRLVEHWQSKAQGSSTEKKLVSEIKQRGVELTEALEQSIARNEELEARLQQQAERCGHLEQTVLQLRESAGAAERAAHKGSKAGAARAAGVEEDVRQLQRVVELYKTLVSMEITLEAPRGGTGGRAAQGSSSSSSSSSSDSSDASTIRCQCFRPGMGGGAGGGRGVHPGPLCGRGRRGGAV